MRKIFVLIILSVMFFGVTVSTHAALIEADLLTAGDGLLTQDTDTGKEWLDLTATSGVTNDDVLAGYGNYTATHGFEFAKEALVRDLVAHAGINVTNRWSTDSAVKSGVLNLQDLLGVTWIPSVGRTITFGYFLSDDRRESWLSLDY